MLVATAATSIVTSGHVKVKAGNFPRTENLYTFSLPELDILVGCLQLCYVDLHPQVTHYPQRITSPA